MPGEYIVRRLTSAVGLGHCSPHFLRATGLKGKAPSDRVFGRPGRGSASASIQRRRCGIRRDRCYPASTRSDSIAIQVIR